MQTRTVNLTAGEVYYSDIPVSAFFTLAESVGAVDITLFEDRGGRGEKAEGVESGYRVMQKTGSPIRFIQIESDTTQTIKYGFSTREIDNKKVTSTVSVVDGSGETSEKGDAYSSYWSQSGVAAKYSHIQLLNPAGSGKNLYLTSMEAYQTFAGTVSVGWLRYNTALANLVSPSYGSANKNFGLSGRGVAEFRQEDLSALVGAEIIRFFPLGQNVPDKFEFDEPLFLPPGTGIVGRVNVVQATLAASVQYFEKDE